MPTSPLLECESIVTEPGLVDLAQQITATLPTKAVILLHGAIGSGKTTLARSICLALGASAEQFGSPTYTLVNIYDLPVLASCTGHLPQVIYHVDLFRVNDPALMLDWDQDEWLNPSGPTLIEWPQVVLPLLSDLPCLNVFIKPVECIDSRVIRLEATDMWFEPLFKRLLEYTAQ